MGTTYPDLKLGNKFWNQILVSWVQIIGGLNLPQGTTRQPCNGMHVVQNIAKPHLAGTGTFSSILRCSLGTLSVVHLQYRTVWSGISLYCVLA